LQLFSAERVSVRVGNHSVMAFSVRAPAIDGRFAWGCLNHGGADTTRCSGNMGVRLGPT
jgi:hypothetical protein